MPNQDFLHHISTPGVKIERSLLGMPPLQQPERGLEIHQLFAHLTAQLAELEAAADALANHLQVAGVLESQGKDVRNDAPAKAYVTPMGREVAERADRIERVRNLLVSLRESLAI